MESKLTCSVAEAAGKLGIGRDRVYELVHSGALPHIAVGRRYRIPLTALTTWLEAAAAENARGAR